MISYCSRLLSKLHPPRNFYYSNRLFLIFFLLLSGFQFDSDKKERLAKLSTNDEAQFIAINQCMMWVANNGMGSHNPETDEAGFLWPGGDEGEIGAIFADGLIWAEIPGVPV